MLIAALDNVLLWIIAFITTLDKRDGEARRASDESSGNRRKAFRGACRP